MRLLEGLHALDRDVRILVAEMRHRRHRGLARRLAADRHAAAVVGDRRRQAAYFLGRAPDQEAAPAIADDADLAGPGDVVDGSLDVLQHSRRRQRLDRGLEARPTGHVVGGIAELDVALDAVERRRRDREVAGRRIAVGDSADVRVDAEDLLQHDDRAPRLFRRLGKIGG